MSKQEEYQTTMDIVKSVRSRNEVLTVSTKDEVTETGLLVFVIVKLRWWPRFRALLFPDLLEEYGYRLESELRERSPEGMETYLVIRA